MTINYDIKKPSGLVRLIVSGSVITGDIIDALGRMLKDPDFKEGMDVLWDFREVKSGNSEAEDIREIVSFIRTNQEKRGRNYRVALVVSRDIDFGLARMYEAYSQELPFDIQIFKDIKDAEQWLNPTE
jgi:hypothetical protein